jgi:hypothetical protein
MHHRLLYSVGVSEPMDPEQYPMLKNDFADFDVIIPKSEPFYVSLWSRVLGVSISQENPFLLNAKMNLTYIWNGCTRQSI